LLDWEIVPMPGIDMNAELEKQAEIAAYCIDHPNGDDSARTLFEQVVEDILLGAGAIEMQISGDANRPLWMWPVDGLTIQIFPGWAGGLERGALYPNRWIRQFRRQWYRPAGSASQR
jgi:hypothetical protein